MENGVAIGSLGAGEAVWHTDMSYLRDAAQGEHALCAGDPARRRQHLLLQTCTRAYDALPAALKPAHRRPRGSSTTAPTTAAAMCGRASRRATIRAPRRARSIRWSAPIPIPGRRMLYLGRRRNAYIGGLDRSRSPKRCSTNSGSYATRDGIRLVTSPGASAIWCCGTTAAPCTGATPSIRARGASCTAPRSRARRRRRHRASARGDRSATALAACAALFRPTICASRSRRRASSP